MDADRVRKRASSDTSNASTVSSSAGRRPFESNLKNVVSALSHDLFKGLLYKSLTELLKLKELLDALVS